MSTNIYILYDIQRIKNYRFFFSTLCLYELHSIQMFICPYLNSYSVSKVSARINSFSPNCLDIWITKTLPQACPCLRMKITIHGGWKKKETAPNSYFIYELMTASCTKSRANRSLEEILGRKQLENNLKTNILEGIITISSSRTHFLFTCLTIIFRGYRWKCFYCI